MPTHGMHESASSATSLVPIILPSQLAHMSLAFIPWMADEDGMLPSTFWLRERHAMVEVCAGGSVCVEGKGKLQNGESEFFFKPISSSGSPDVSAICQGPCRMLLVLNHVEG